MKILKLLNKYLKSFIIFLLLLPSRAIAYKAPDPQSWYGVPNDELKKIEPDENVLDSFLNILKICFIPLIILIGCIIYFKKSKSSTYKKIITILIFLSIVVLLYFLAKYVITEIYK